MREPAVSLARWLMAMGVIVLVWEYVLAEPLSPQAIPTQAGSGNFAFMYNAGLTMMIMSLVLNALGCFLFWLKKTPSTRARRFFERLAWWKPIRVVLDAPLVYFLALCALAVATGLVLWFFSGVEFLLWIGEPSFRLVFWGILSAIFGVVLQWFYEDY